MRKALVEPLHPTSGFSSTEETLNAVTHGLGALLGIAGLVVSVSLAAMHAKPWLVVACAIYGTTLVLLYTASTLYHAIRHLPAKGVFMVLDQCGIYLLIAGSYTPFLLGPLRGPLGWTFFGIIWAMAVTGIVLECVSREHGGLRSSITYLAMGWLFLAVFLPLVPKISTFGLAMIVAGGVLYSVGVAFYLMRRVPYAHTVWHLFVLGGSTCNFLAVLSLL